MTRSGATEDLEVCATPIPNCSAWSSPPQRTESFAYDSHNRLQKVTHPDATFITYAYDTRGNLKSVKDERHSVPNTTYSYDGLNRLTSALQTLGGGSITTSYGYDLQDNLTSVADPNTNVTTYENDDFRRLQKQISLVTGTTTYSYDEAGNLLTTTDANNATTTRAYDAANRILTATSTRTGRPTETVTWTYDNSVVSAYGLGRVATMTDPTGTTVYSYERRGLLKAERKAVWDNTLANVYGYDANGNRTTITYPSKRLVTYAYDFADRQSQATGVLAPNPSITYVNSAKYQAFGPPNELKFGNATTRAMTYNQRYQMTRNKLTRDSNGAVLANYGLYTYDGAGNITALPDVDSTYSRTLLEYDDLNRLKTANAGSNLWGAGTFTYDAMGNVSSLSLAGPPARTASFTLVGTTPKIQSVTEQSPIGTRAVTYDTAGNETAVGSATYVYSSRNFLGSGDGYAYSYDGRGVRTVTRENVIAITSISPASRAAGLPTFTLTVDGNNFTGSSVVKWNGSNRTTTFVSSNQLTATINASDVSAAGTIGSVTVATSTPASFVVDFTDVSSGNAFYTPITIIASRGITSGCGAGTYCPTGTVTRDAMAKFLLRAFEGPNFPVPACTGLFVDFACSNNLAPWAEELYRRGITSGCNDVGQPLAYCPSGAVTREAMAKFLLKTLEGSTYTPPPAIGIFTDVPTSNPFAPMIEEIARRGISTGCGTNTYCPAGTVTRDAMAKFLVKTWGFTQAVTPGGLKRFFFYTPEMNLLAESEYTSAYHPQVLYEHFWIAGQPVAEVDTGTNTTHWTLTDHLGTPILWTDSAVAVNWRVEHEPYGQVFKLRSGGNVHQALRLPGQEAEQLSPNETALNGGTEKSYNIFRWYRPNWGRYTQPDPLGVWGSGDANLYRYVLDNPIRLKDPEGLRVQVCCRELRGLIFILNSFDHHCFIRAFTNNGVPVTYSLFPDRFPNGRGFTRINDPSDLGAT